MNPSAESAGGFHLEWSVESGAWRSGALRAIGIRRDVGIAPYMVRCDFAEEWRTSEPDLHGPPRASAPTEHHPIPHSKLQTPNS